MLTRHFLRLCIVYLAVTEPQAAEKLFIFLFVLQDEDITELSSLREAGLKADISASVLDKIETLMQTEPVKEKLKRNTQEALDEGVSRRFSTNLQLVHLYYCRQTSRAVFKGGKGGIHPPQ